MPAAPEPDSHTGRGGSLQDSPADADVADPAEGDPAARLDRGEGYPGARRPHYPGPGEMDRKERRMDPADLSPVRAAAGRVEKAGRVGGHAEPAGQAEGTGTVSGHIRRLRRHGKKGNEFPAGSE